MEQEYYVKEGDRFIRIDSLSLLGEKITISFEEYKELLIIKGKYEELKSQQNIPWLVNPNKTVTPQEWNKDKDFIKVTC